ncbi:HK97 family phage prohead protease [Dyadobacter sp. CY327]|uniref:HK97 family phage prohead protease n=1 Tax=Dyadobacter sp. CY327 TaxID=2907301 RepID=UPI001F480CB7|nr:HK97 family phage prohead protease [Dyadobacter sp. CY327]MCE7071997.1 HK97 family phage prohead protease [Dyadobacter sp. CY327]
MEREKRVIPQSLSEVRAVEIEGGGYQIPGKGIVFNQRSQKLGWFVEIIDPRALDEADMSDIVATYNHDMNYVLGRSTNNTLSYTIDSEGLNYVITPPDNQTIRDIVLAPIIRRDVTGSSFMFSVANRGDDWEEQPDGLVIRYVRKIDTVFEFGPVTMPAYRQTTTDAQQVAKRSFDEFIEETKKKELTYRSEFTRLKLELIGR